jgi:hypothetical protein
MAKKINACMILVANSEGNSLLKDLDMGGRKRIKCLLRK